MGGCSYGYYEDPTTANTQPTAEASIDGPIKSGTIEQLKSETKDTEKGLAQDSVAIYDALRNGRHVYVKDDNNTPLSIKVEERFVGNDGGRVMVSVGVKGAESPLVGYEFVYANTEEVPAVGELPKVSDLYAVHIQQAFGPNWRAEGVDGEEFVFDTKFPATEVSVLGGKYTYFGPVGKIDYSPYLDRTDAKLQYWLNRTADANAARVALDEIVIG